MKIVLIGCVQFSQAVLKTLISLDANVVGVITKEKSSFNNDFYDLSSTCKQNDIDCIYTKSANNEQTINWIKSKSIDIILCVGWSEILKKEILDIPNRGVIGFHPALLPQNRGRHPIIWALALGLDKTGSTFFFMKEEADNGDIISQKIIKIKQEDDAFSLYNTITKKALMQIENFLPKLEKNTLKTTAQDSTKASYWRKRDERDGKIDFRMSSQNIHNLVRALSNPYPGATIVINDTNFIVWKTNPIKDIRTNIEAEKILNIEDKIITVKTGDGAIELLKHNITVSLKVGQYIR